MHRITTAILTLAVFAFAAVSSCTVKVDPATPVAEEGLSLVFSCDDGFQVKSTVEKEGEDAYNENLLSSVEYFLYPEGKTDENAVLHGYLANVRKDVAYSIPVTDEIIRDILCPGNAKYFYVYAIANHTRIVPAAATGTPEDLSGTSVPELETLTRDIDMDGSNISTPQSNFLMASDGAVISPQIKRRNITVATVNVPLKRVAAKISIVVRTTESVTIDNTIVIDNVTDVRHEVWKPRTSEMQVYLVNGAKTGQVSGEPLTTSDLFEYQAVGFDYDSGETHDYSTYEYDAVNEDYNEVSHTGTFYPAETPFYTYPESWEYGSDEEPYIKIVIPWDREAGVSDNGTAYGVRRAQYYYRVYCPGTAVDGTHAQFLRNNWYKVILNVAILGSEFESGAMIIKGDYYVVDWQEREKGSSGTGINDSDKEAEIKGARYLFVNEEEYKLFNINNLDIPYVTSDVCEIVDMSAYRYNFSGSTKAQETKSGETGLEQWGMSLNLVTTATGAHVRFSHTLNNDLNTTDYDVSEYVITFTLRHKDSHSYSKTITIYQYPAIMIDMDNNNGGTHDGYTYVNNGSTTNATYGTNGTSSGNNTNFNMFIVETSVLPSDSEYMLGDPRLAAVDNLNSWPTRNTAVSNWSANTASIQGNTRRLSYYHPVDNSEAANNIIAPRFRVASSHGATGSLSYANAFRRCASYQEKGYPAGRWRLPTVAEISYITKLNADGKIVRLFGSDDDGSTTDYWCNSGYMTVYDGTNAASKQAPVPHPGVTDGSRYVRCVYDEWYWDGMKYGNTDVTTVTPLTTFKWGDMQ